ESREFFFPSSDGKTQLRAVEWLPEGEARAVLQICHGVSEYILRYEDFARFLTENGFAVVGHDHLSHGASIAEGAPPLYFGKRGSWDFVIRDIEARRGLARERFPNVPYFLLGHSMGSFAARTYLLRYPSRVDGAILMGTGQMGKGLLAAGRALTTLACLFGEAKPSPLINAIAFGPYDRPFAPNRTAFDWLSANEENVDRYIADPLCGGVVSAGLFREMLAGIAEITNGKNLQAMDKSTPILFISGAMDPVGDCSAGVKRAYESFLRAGCTDVMLTLYDGLRHEILQEREKETVYADLLAWLTAHFPAP
ncbi:MAG: lysophospholipase, partial [Oscillibacter sp.]|nr:lysophospholipase [Oscillibacter sp.]